MSRRFFPLVLLSLLALPAAAQETKSAPAKKAPAKKSSTASKAPAKAPVKSTPGTELTTQKQKLSYALGLSMGKDFKNQAVDLDFDIPVTSRKFRIECPSSPDFSRTWTVPRSSTGVRCLGQKPAFAGSNASRLGTG